jgi:hypothetical protein
MVSDRLIVVLLIVAILLSVFSIVITMSVNAKAQLNPPIEGNNQANIQLTVVENPQAGPGSEG